MDNTDQLVKMISTHSGELLGLLVKAGVFTEVDKAKIMVKYKNLCLMQLFVNKVKDNLYY